MKHFTITLRPDGKQVTIHEGATLLEAAGQAGIIINTVCGGRGTCKKCIAIIEPEGKEVLACQYRIQSDLTVTIPQSSRFFEQKILEHGIDTQIKPSGDLIEKYKGITGSDKIFGLAVDIGTTTVVAKLINMSDGKCSGTEAVLNPQCKYGDDVISRIAYAQDDGKFDELHESITDCLNELISNLCKKNSINKNDIYEVCVVGNTTMNHIFLELPISQLGQAPYNAYSLDAYDISPDKSGLQINHEGNIHTVENIAGFVGADTVAVALAVDIDSEKDNTLVVDIGTNGELVLAANGKFYAASCAAGPALEGARIICGSRAMQGAIEAVVLNENDIDIDVIGDRPASSICGSGLIDAVAVMLELGVIDKTGRFVEPAKLEGNIPAGAYSRIYGQDGEPAFKLAENEDGKVFLTQRDIRQVQLAKAAIKAGIKLLQKKVGLEDSDISKILLAGAFGNYVRAESALRIGLLPSVPVEKIHFVGNAAASGAIMALLNRQYREKARELARKIEYVEIAHEPEFQDVYADSMLFG
ncbi:MAG: ASKHA domain-containing protein [Phycisphaerales bacterium]|jgi:uncharacterized 2Fe-2S/4Fe-4S cluster protein (DUF4445 family)